MQEDTFFRLARVQFMRVVDAEDSLDVHGLVTVQLREVTSELTNMDIGKILDMAYLILQTDRHWLLVKKALCKKRNSKIATVLKTQRRSKDHYDK